MLERIRELDIDADILAGGGGGALEEPNNLRVLENSREGSLRVDEY
jgi:hypothetical protein